MAPTQELADSRSVDRLPREKHTKIIAWRSEPSAGKHSQDASCDTRISGLADISNSKEATSTTALEAERLSQQLQALSIDTYEQHREQITQHIETTKYVKQGSELTEKASFPNAPSITASAHNSSNKTYAEADHVAAAPSMSQDASHSWLTADSFRAACTKEEIELEEQQLLKSDFATSRRIQELCALIVSKTDSLKQLIRSDSLVEDQEVTNRRFVDVAAVARLARDMKESRDHYLRQQVEARRTVKAKAVGQTQPAKVV